MISTPDPSAAFRRGGLAQSLPFAHWLEELTDLLATEGNI